MVRIKPNASREGIEKVIDGHLVVRVSSPPVEGKANRDLIRIIAKELSVPPTSIELKKGRRSRMKTLLIRGWHPLRGIKKS